MSARADHSAPSATPSSVDARAAVSASAATSPLTDYQAKYFAWELSKRCPPDSIEKLAGALVDAQVDLNPHQVDAAL